MNRRMRIAHVIAQLDMGGLEKLLVEFARHADRDRFDLRFVSLSTRGTLANDIEEHDWPVVAMQERPDGLRPGLVLRLANLFRRWKVDLVHTHNIKAHLYGAPAARLGGIPALVQTRHGQAVYAGCRSLTAFRLASLVTDQVVCVSLDSKRLAARVGVASRKLRCVWNGIDLARFACTGPHRGGPVVTVARLSPEKDIQNLIRAAALVSEVQPSFQLRIAGAGPCLEELQRLSSDLCLSDRVHFLGEVRDVPGLLAQASLFVLPSLTEGVSLTLLEAMAVGLPVVATAVGGNREVVLDNDTGHLVPAGDPQSLAAAIIGILADPERGRVMGERGRQRVEEHFDVRNMVRQYEEIYTRILMRASRKRVLCR